MQNEHTVKISERAHISLSGIEEVISYDENNIVMQTNMGQLTIDGSTLNIVKLSLEEGQVTIEGRLDAFYYMEQKEKRPLFSRIFS